MSDEVNKKFKEEILKLKNSLLKDLKDAEENPSLEISEGTDPDSSQLLFDRMSGSMGVDVSEEEWISMKVDKIKSKSIENK